MFSCWALRKILACFPSVMGSKWSRPARKVRQTLLKCKSTQGTVCTILDEQEVKPHKVRYYLERRDPAFNEKMVEVPEGERGPIEDGTERRSGDRLL
jgi:hypothetical protein